MGIRRRTIALPGAVFAIAFALAIPERPSVAAAAPSVGILSAHPVSSDGRGKTASTMGFGAALPLRGAEPLPDGKVAVTWVFGDEQFLSCDPPSTALRAIQQRFGEEVEFSAVFVGSDPAMARTFLRLERMQLPVSVISPSEYTRLYKDHRRPIVIASDGPHERVLGRTAWSVASSRPTSELELVISQFASHVHRP